MNIQPIRGMKDFLPNQTRLRDYTQRVILDTYQKSGFERISTPILEDIGNLMNSEGGDNLNLIFQVMKRGAKFDEAFAQGRADQLSDMGLRYDLTLPLARFYAANHAVLPNPFKVIQIDRAYRAERPQKGRNREFMQCDIDIIGDYSINAEIELMTVTAQALSALGFSGFSIHVNDRRVLRGLLSSMGFKEEVMDGVCICLDKLDKINIDGVCAELADRQYDRQAIQSLYEFLSKNIMNVQDAACMLPDKSPARELETIISSVRALSDGKYGVEYTPALVRGQGYYTGAVFEVVCADFPGALAGGGRYDGMIGKFLGADVPAVGFSIGFERICALLAEHGFTVPASPRLALIYKGDDEFLEALKKAGQLRRQYNVTVLRQAAKPGKQLAVLKNLGYNAAAHTDSADIVPFDRPADPEQPDVI